MNFCAKVRQTSPVKNVVIYEKYVKNNCFCAHLTPGPSPKGEGRRERATPFRNGK
jgi:hypothetical protein